MNKEFGDNFLKELELLVESKSQVHETVSYTSKLVNGGLNKVAQKVGEEAVETVIEAKDGNDNLFLNESADLLFHYIILLQAKGYGLDDVVRVLEQREKK